MFTQILLYTKYTNYLQHSIFPSQHHHRLFFDLLGRFLLHYKSEIFNNVLIVHLRLYKLYKHFCTTQSYTFKHLYMLYVCTGCTRIFTIYTIYHIPYIVYTIFFWTARLSVWIIKVRQSTPKCIKQDTWKDPGIGLKYIKKFVQLWMTKCVVFAPWHSVATHMWYPPLFYTFTLVHSNRFD